MYMCMHIQIHGICICMCVHVNMCVHVCMYAGVYMYVRMGFPGATLGTTVGTLGVFGIVNLDRGVGWCGLGGVRSDVVGGPVVG